MCGIAGVVSGYSMIEQREVVARMLKPIVYRGPDSSGIKEFPGGAFGHQRLSIIDLSESGQQPMFYMERYIITYNGEIYNYLELKAELVSLGCNFRSHSDTEVILAAYSVWGEDCVLRFNGMYAFGIYDLVSRALFIARDPIGEKPLYYCNVGEYFYFFSEPKQVIFSGILPFVPNENAIREYLSYQFTLSNETFFSGCYKLLPGECANYRRGELKVRRYWDPRLIAVDYSITYQDAVSEVRSLVEQAVELRLRSDVNVATYLSGGIDSTIVAILAKQKNPGLTAFTFASAETPELDETPSASKTAIQNKIRHHTSELCAVDFLETWINSTYHMDEPTAGHSLIAQSSISQEVSKHTKVILGGQGGDELFFGYGWYANLIGLRLVSGIPDFDLPHRLNMLFGGINLRKLRDLYKTYKMVTHGCSTSLQSQYLAFWLSLGCYAQLRNKDAVRPLHGFCKVESLADMRTLEFSNWLPALMHVEDRASMAASLESRAPLLDIRLSKLALSLPPTFSLGGRLNKKILQDAFRDILPDHILSSREKRGFSTPLNRWLFQPAARRFIDNVLADSESFIYRFVEYNLNNVQKMTPKQIWMLISVEIWHRIFLTRGLEIGS